MSVFSWVSSRFSDRAKALSLYRRGMVRARKHDHRGAIDDYTATLAMSEIPADVKAMVLYNRGLAHIAAGNERRGVADLEAVMAMDGTPVNVKTMARQRLFRMEFRTRREAQ